MTYFVLTAFLSFSYWIILVARFSNADLSALERRVGISFLITLLFGLLLISTYISEFLIALNSRKKQKLSKFSSNNFKPFVSIHVPIRKEPVDVVKRTLRALSKLNYTNTEVIIIYNNTSERELWHPIAKYSKFLNSSSKIKAKISTIYGHP